MYIYVLSYMSIGEKNLSGNAGGQNFRFWNKPFAPEKIKIEDTDDSNEGTASVGVKPQPKRRSTNPNANVGSAGPSGRPKRTGTGGSVSGRREYGDRNPVVSESQIQDDQPQFDSHTPLVSKTRPKLNLDPFQESIYYSLIPVENTLRTEVYSSNIEANQVGGIHSIPITSSSVVGESGSGLTLMLAKKAYENYQDGRPTIILTHREHLFHKVAQSIVDFAEPSKRDNLLKQIEVISAGVDLHNIDPSKKIYIVSADKLKNYLTENPSYRQVSYPAMTMGAKTWRRELEHNKLSDILPLRRVREVLVDEVNRYTGTSNEGFSKVLTTLMQETSTDPERNPVHLFGTSSTPYARSTEGAQEESRYATLEFDQLFPELSRKVTPNPRELIEEAKFYKKPVLSTISLDERIQREMPHKDAKDRLIDAGKSSINDNIVSIYENEARIAPGKKWHIIANTREHANQLCALFNTRGVNAKVATSSHKGHFEPLSELLSETDSRRGIFTLNDAENENDKTPLRKVSQKVEDIIDDYENGDCNVLIDIDHHSCIHSTKTDKVVALNLEETDSRTKHLLGEAVKDRSGPQNQTIEYMFLRSSALESFRSLISDDQFNLDAVPKSRASSRNDAQAIALRTETGMSVDVVGGIEFNRNWLNNGLRSVLENKYPDVSIEEAAVRLTDDFYSHRISTDKTIDELKFIVSGLTKDTKVFSELISFIEEDLRDVYQAELRRNNFNLREELTTAIPDLMGVANEKLAQRVLSKSFENLVMNDQNYNPDEEWQARMDAALGLGAHERGDVRENHRIKLFTKLIARKFGLEFFENRSFLQKALKVFNGAETDFKLFGLLVNTLVGDGDQGSGRGFSFDNIRQEFPHLLGSQRVVPFGALQRKILAKYPDGPPMDQGLTRFFREQLYDDFAIDFATLTNSVTNHSRATDPDQEIIDGSVQGEIYNFLESVYTAEANVEMPAESQLRPSEAQFKTEVEAKAKEHLSTVTREVLYNQLIAKIWGQGRSVRINNDDFVFRLEADELSLAPKTDSSLEDQIDMTKVNPNWLLAVDHGVNGSSFDRVDIKKRIAVITAAFLAHKNGIGSRVQDALNTKEQKGDEYLVMSGVQRSRHNIIEAELNPQQLFLDRELNTKECRELEVLLGQTARSKLTQDDKSLLREFLEFHKIKLKTVLPRFYDRLGVESLDEAKAIVHHELNNLNSTNQEWMAQFGDHPEELIARFFFEDERYENVFKSPQVFRLILSSISGDMSRVKDSGTLRDYQDINREFINFANQNGFELKTEELVLNFRDQIGLRTRAELFATINQAEFVNFEDSKSDLNPNRYTNSTPQGVKSFVGNVAKKLEMTSSELFALAALRDPGKFYRQPMGAFNQYLADKLEFDGDTNSAIRAGIDKILVDEKDHLLARDLLIRAFPDKYKGLSIFVFPEAKDSSPRVRAEIYADQVKLTEQYVKPKKKSNEPNEWINADFKTFRHVDDNWTVHDQQENFNFQHMRVSVLVNQILTKNKSTLDQNWLKRIGLEGDMDASSVKINNFVKLVDSFIRSKVLDHDLAMLRDNRNSFIGIVHTCLGNPKFFNNNPDGQRVFREFINFINNPPEKIGFQDEKVSELGFGPLDLNDVIKESPKLTGVQSFDELKSVLDSGLHDFTASRKAADTLSRLSELTGTSVNDMLNFSRVDQEVESYKKGFVELGFEKDVFDHAFRNIHDSDILRSSILNRLLFEDTHNNDFCKFDLSFPVADGKDFFEMVFSQDRISVDLFHQRNGSTKLVTFISVDKLKDGWERKIASDHEVQARRAFTSAAGSFDTRAQNLIEAMKQAISPDNKFDYLAFSVSSLITEFLEESYPSCFGETDMAIIPVFRTIFGMSKVPNAQIIANQFIDFAKERFPALAELPKDPRFAEIFSGNLDQRSDFEKIKQSIIENFDAKQVQKMFKSANEANEVVVQLLDKANEEMNLNLSHEELFENLEVHDDMGAHLDGATRQMSKDITESLLGVNAADLAQLKSVTQTISRELKDHPMQELRFKSIEALKKLYPNAAFDLNATQANHHLISITLRDRVTNAPLKFEFDFEFDGQNFSLIKVDHDTKEVRYLLSYSFDESSNTWIRKNIVDSVSTDLNDTQRSIQYLKENFDPNQALEIYKKAQSAYKGIEKLAMKAESDLGLATYSVEAIADELNIPSNMIDHLKSAFIDIKAKVDSLADLIPEDEIALLLSNLASFPAEMSQQQGLNQDIRATASFKRLYPGIDLDVKTLDSRRDLMQIRSKDSSEYEYYLEYNGEKLLLYLVNKETYKIDRVLTGEIENLKAKPKQVEKLGKNEAIELLKKEYPEGITDPEDLPAIAKAHGIDMEQLKSLVDVEGKYSNLIDIMSKTILDNVESLDIRFDQESSVRKLFSTAFEGENLSRIYNKLIAEKIWDQNPFEVKISFVKSALEINFNGDVEVFKLSKRADGSTVKDLSFSLAQDPKTGMYIPQARDGSVLTLKGEGKELDQKIRNLVSSQFVVPDNKRHEKAPMKGSDLPSRLEAVLSYLQKITGKSEVELFESVPSADQIQAKYNSGFRKLLTHLFPRDSRGVSSYLTKINDSMKQANNTRLLKLDHLMKRIWGSVVDPYKQFSIGSSYESEFSKQTKLTFLMKPDETRIDLYDAETNKALRLFRVADYDVKKETWGQVTEHDQFFS